MSTAEAAPVRGGDILAGKYVVEKVLGAGGMGVVVAARHTQLGQRVAVKPLLPEVCERPEAVRRFLREAHAAGRSRASTWRACSTWARSRPAPPT
jgi:serine/threonine-protein kinase